MDGISQQSATRYMDDEIDLMELFVILIRGWKLISGAVFFCLACAFSYLYVTSSVYNVALDIKPIPKHEALVYEGLNQGVFVKVTSGSLLSGVMADLEQRETLITALEETGYLHEKSAEIASDGAQRAVDFANSLELVPPTSPEDKKAKIRKKYWTLQAKVESPERLKLVLKSALEASERNVKGLNQEVFAQNLAIYKQKQKYKEEDAHAAYDALLAEYDDKVANRLSFLKEQGEIARHLGIARNAVEAQEFVNRSTGAGAVIASLEYEPQFYMRGYKAIDKEVELIEARKVKESHIGGVVGLRKQLRSILEDKTIEREQKAFDASPLGGQGEFSAVKYDLRAMGAESARKDSLILALSVVLGGMLGVFAVFIRQGIRSYRARESEQA